MKYLRLLLFPFSLIYGLIVMVRNWCYDTGAFKSHEFDLPVIAVGNLTIGGAGKSPMTEYLIRLLKQDYKPATLSRGYGRETKGFKIASSTATASRVGDEPAQFKHTFPDITVAVCEKRVDGIEQLKADHDLIILDDAYQHRAVKPGLSILLFDYNSLDASHLVLPAGNYREPFSGRWRADVIIISKCPEDLDEAMQDSIAAGMALLPWQQLYFTTISYMRLHDMDGNPSMTVIDKDTTVFLLTGIANATPLLAHIKKQTINVIHHNYPDHHRFSLKNITKLADEFAACASQKKVIVTTEKDAQRLGEQELLPLIKRLPVLVMPIGVMFLEDQQQFDQFVIEYVRKFREHHPVH
ncbi:tetraacyldisaccharide 4'-kinase [Mucilaginibacter corticis]|uniref:Tetraacyldisaccharide 4'-kinase n=1 Tax=Mucilaginibacter corticis TaxID=2597670 RepID=A0A556MKT5_9SPHI|nr:tetraacyldisaccharide 4'-kinase [Mucilaginibacter corticis]TSJ40445.1 tetraacyldisaccharide 4'-kinase [Mucilaginibacter corticis]